ncbi:MAG: response regulator [Candidatus Omnitrophica bacterium]|nr:response regulator [Candidatus Omnitrophota bacterium]
MKETILIVDDEKIICDLLVSILQESGDYRLLTASDGEEALEIFQKEEIDLVFTDLRMPIMGGIELLAEIRQKRPTIPVVIITGYGRREDVIEAMRLGASNFLLKPQEIDMIYSVASKILRMRCQEKLEQEIYQFFTEDYRFFTMPNDLQYTLPLIDVLTDKIEQIGVCDASEIINIRFALDEALVNAIIHGNLEIDSSIKGASLDKMMEFDKFVQERSEKEPYKQRTVKVSRQLTPDFVRFTIEDQGKGFNWRVLPESLDGVDLLSNYGRGLFLIRTFMSSVEFNDAGNRITLTKHRCR